MQSGLHAPEQQRAKEHVKLCLKKDAQDFFQGPAWCQSRDHIGRLGAVDFKLCSAHKTQAANVCGCSAGSTAGTAGYCSHLHNELITRSIATRDHWKKALCRRYKSSSLKHTNDSGLARLGYLMGIH